RHRGPRAFLPRPPRPRRVPATGPVRGLVRLPRPQRGERRPHPGSGGPSPRRGAGVSAALDPLAEQLRSEDTPIAAHVIDTGVPVGSEAPDDYALVMEAVREGYLLHYGESRLLTGHDDDLPLLPAASPY